MKIKTTLIKGIKLYLLFICFITSLIQEAHAQTDGQNNFLSPVTLDYDNYIVPPIADYFMQGANGSKIKVPLQGTNQSWDYSVLEKNDAFNFSASYQRVNNGTFAVARRQHDFVFMLGGIIALKQTGYEVDNQNSFNRAGRSLQLQKFPLQTLTGTPTDSLIFDTQEDFDQGNFIFVDYPCTVNSSWSSTVRVVTKFQISVAAFGYSNSSGQFVQIQTLTRTVVGSGRMRIPAGAGKTPYIPVLMIKSQLTTTDSVYINNALAPDALLRAFGLQQGQQSFDNCYTFLRQGIDAPLITFNMNNAFSSIRSVQYDARYTNIYCGNKEMLCMNGSPKCVSYPIVTPVLLTSDGVTIGNCNNKSSAINNITRATDNIVLLRLQAFPNPTHDQFYLAFNNEQKNTITIRVSDVTGRVLLQLKTTGSNIIFGDQLKQGVYFAEIVNGDKIETIKLFKL